MNKHLIFYNHCHNGDIHYSREFVKDLMKKLQPLSTTYKHYNNTTILKDIDLVCDKNLPRDGYYNQQLSVSITNDTIYINTWVGQKGGHYMAISKRDCSLYTNYEIFKDIYQALNIPIEPIEFYVPTIDFDRIDQKSNIDSFIQNNPGVKILICNGLVQSGQCDNFDFKTHTEYLSKQHPELIFILCEKSNINLPNVFYTSDIIQSTTGDLNEIAYLSTFCEIIIGRCSGPYAFSHIKENFNNPEKKFLAFSNYINDMWWGFLNDEYTKSKSSWSKDYSSQNIFLTMKKIIEN